MYIYEDKLIVILLLKFKTGCSNFFFIIHIFHLHIVFSASSQKQKQEDMRFSCSFMKLTNFYSCNQMAVYSNQPLNLKVRVIQIHYVHLYLQNRRNYFYQIMQYYGTLIHTVGQNDSTVFHLPETIEGFILFHFFYEPTLYIYIYLKLIASSIFKFVVYL